ncbi:MAG TPA: DNA mismatch repair endonuclease MutL [Gemmataceae bacterium]|jgi:DNA mismatch repair protein MutL|nr:DNA mismatch repair endonuclease MutL [Gemmataceae bacterium]
MPRIHQLPTSVITKIAAGEVIERPASVVKELLENSIDAGATRIDIELEQGGGELIRVVDDGHGIDPADLPLVFASHATSKLNDADDLFRIGTLGFRGEAMASIGGVAHVAVQSRTPQAPEGCELICDGGVIGPVRPWNGAAGTRVEVRRLFFNTPVRKKFMRTIPTELSHVVETVTRLTLANPTLHVVLRHNGRLVHEIPREADLLDRIGLFFGKEIRAALIEVRSDHGPVSLFGFVADPACDRGNARLQYLFVNGRCVRDRSLGHALQEGFRGLLMSGRYAVGFLFLQLPPDQVDVNVHPTKSEVRFRDSQSLYHLVRAGVKRALASKNLVPRLQAPDSPPEPRDYPPIDLPPASMFAPAANPLPEPRVLNPAPAAESQVSQSHETPASPTAITPEPIIRAMQIQDAYLVVETRDGMVVIDQHALHERILYEQLRRRMREGKLEVQRLLIPEPVELTMEQAALIMESRAQLAELGLEVEDFGSGTVAVSSFPALLGRLPVGQIFQSVVDVLTTKDRPPTRDQLFDHLLATMACKAAVKAGDRLSAEEIDYLMRLRPTAEDSHHCPHGRPTSLVFSRHELDKQFKRI